MSEEISISADGLTSSIPLCGGCHTRVGELWAVLSLQQYQAIWCVHCLPASAPGASRTPTPGLPAEPPGLAFPPGLKAGGSTSDEASW